MYNVHLTHSLLCFEFVELTLFTMFRPYAATPSLPICLPSSTTWRNVVPVRKMRELTEKLPNFLPGKEPLYKTEASSFFTTFYNLNWGENGRISVEEVADRVNSTLKKYPVNEGASERKFGVNEKSSEKRFGVNEKGSEKRFGVKGEDASKRVSRTGQKIIDLVISDPSITAEAMSVKIGVSKRAVEKNIKELRERGILVHEGSDKAGYWRIIVKS